jgi:putative flavoprotein involved in K+ transport
MDGISTSNSAIEATAWLGEFGAALALGKVSRIALLLGNECHWRDILALRWNLRTASDA